MKEEDHKNLDKFIRENMETKRPSIDFSDKIMQQIFSSELKKEKALGNLVQKHALEVPSNDFTDKVMNQLLKENSYAFVYKPVIGKKVWFSIAFVLGLILIYSFLNMEYRQIQFDYFDKYIAKLDHLFSFQLPELFLSPIFAFSLFTLSLFLWIDYFIQNRHKSHSSNVI